MAFEIIPLKQITDGTYITVSDNIPQTNQKGYLHSVSHKVLSIIPEESKIIVDSDVSNFTVNENIQVVGTTNNEYDGEYLIMAIDAPNNALMINIDKYYDGSPRNENTAYVVNNCNPNRYSIIGIEINNPANSFVIPNDNTSLFNINERIIIYGSPDNDKEYTISTTPTTGSLIYPIGVMDWMDQDIYATDTHLHITMTHNLNAERKGGDFYNSPGSDKRGLIDIKARPTLMDYPIYPASLTLLSFNDGQVKTILNSFHTPERAMALKMSHWTNTITTLLALSSAGGVINAGVWYMFILNGLLGRVTISLNQYVKGKNWLELKDEIAFFRKLLNDIANNPSYSKMILITNQTLFNDYLQNRIKPHQIIKVLSHLEGGHQFDMDAFKMNPYFAIEDIDHPEHANPPIEANDYQNSGKEPLHPYYGGFKSADICTAIDRLEMLILDPNDPNFNNFPNESKKYAIGLVAWTPMHGYWNGLGGHGKMIYDSAKAAMPDPKKYMTSMVSYKKEKAPGIPNSKEEIKRGFCFDRNTHLTELGRQMIKFAFTQGVIVDLKHFHSNARLQIINMAERGFDYDPVYNVFGDPKLHSDTNFKEKGELLPAKNPEMNDPSIEISPFAKLNRNVYRQGSLKNEYQILVTHAGVSYVDDNGTNLNNIKNKIIDGKITDLNNDDIPNLNYYETCIKKILRNEKESWTKKTLNIRYDFEYIYNDPNDHTKITGFKLPHTPDGVKNEIYSIINDVNNTVPDDIPTTGGIPTSFITFKENLKKYLKYFLPLLLRSCHEFDNLNLSNNEIARIIKLRGLIGFISEDRVARTNERMFGNGMRKKGNWNRTFSYFNPNPNEAIYDARTPYNINIWPMYGDDFEKNDDDGKKYLYGTPLDFKAMYDDSTPNFKPRIPIEDELAFGNNGLFQEIQNGLIDFQKLYKERDYGSDYYNNFKHFTDLDKRLFKNGNDRKFKNNDYNKPNFKIQAIAGIEALYRSIDQIARVAREKVYYASNPDLNLSKYALNVDDSVDDETVPIPKIGIRTKLKKYYQNICISSDFDGLTDPLDLFASPRMYPIMALYIANRLKWDLYRRYCAKPTPTSLGNREYIVGNDTIGPERGQTLAVDEGAYLYLDYFRDLDADGVQVNDDLNDIVKDVMKQILDTNFINMAAYARGWATPPIN